MKYKALVDSADKQNKTSKVSAKRLGADTMWVIEPGDICTFAVVLIWGKTVTYNKLGRNSRLFGEMYLENTSSRMRPLLSLCTFGSVVFVAQRPTTAVNTPPSFDDEKKKQNEKKKFKNCNSSIFRNNFLYLF